MQRIALLVLACLLLAGCAETRGSADVTISDPQRDDQEFDPVPWVIALILLALIVGIIAAAAAGAGQRQQQVIVIRERSED